MATDGSNKTLLVAVIIVLIIMLLKQDPRPANPEGFLPTQTWEDWDNYDQDHGNTRAYWGSMDPEGGWTGNPHAPMNDPSGLGFGAATPDYSAQYQPRQRGFSRQGARPVSTKSIAHATDGELSAMYRSGIMATK
jgi:hypothetical protein